MGLLRRSQFRCSKPRLERRSDLVDDRACTSVRKGRHEPLAQPQRGRRPHDPAALVAGERPTAFKLVAGVEQLQHLAAMGDLLGLRGKVPGRRPASLWARLTKRPWLRSIATNAALAMWVSLCAQF